MNKKLTKIVGITLGLSMAVGVGAGIAISNSKQASPVFADPATETITLQESTFSGMGSNNYGSGVEYTGSVTSSVSSTSIDVGGHYITKNSGWQWQANNANVYNITELPGRITNITVTQTGTARAFTAYGGDEQLFSSSETGTGKSPSGDSLGEKATASMSWNISAEKDYTFFAIHKGANAGKVTSIVITFEKSEAPTKANVTLSCADVNVDVSSEPVALAVTATSGGNPVSLSPYTYDIDDDTVATVSNTGVVTPVEIGSTKLTINYAGNENYNPASKIINVSVSNNSLSVSNLTFTAACGGSGTANDGAVWSVESDGSESTFADDGIHYGTNSAYVTYVELKTSDLFGNVKQVVVTTRDAQAQAEISVSVGSSSFTCSGSATATATNTSTAYAFRGNARGEITVRIDRGESKQKALYVKSIIVYFDKITLSSIALSGTYQTTFDQGAEFNHDGMVVTATFSDSTTENVTSNAVWTGGDLSEAGEKTVTVTYKTQTKTYTINVVASTMYTVGGTINNGSLSSTEDIREGLALSILINANHRYERPATLSVTMDGNTLVLGSGYTYNPSTGVFNIASVTGNVVINGECSHKHGYWEDDPFTVAEARAVVSALEVGDTLANGYVKGIISQVDAYLSSYHSITYWISDDGAANNQFEVYSGKGVDSANFSSIDDVEVGASVLVTGTLKKYSSSVFEFDKNNYLVSYTAPTNASLIRIQLASSSSVAMINGEEVWSSGIAPEKLVFSTFGYADGEQHKEEALGDGNFTVTFNGGSNDGKYYSGGSGMRTYSNGSFTVQSLYTITKIKFAFDGSNKPQSDDVADVGTYDEDTDVWTGEATSVTLTRPSENGHWRLQSVEVFFGSITGVNSLKLRLGASISVEAWNAINAIENVEITDYGVMLFRTDASHLASAPTVEDAYADYPTAITISRKNSADVPFEDNGNYIFTTKINITSPSNYNMYFCARAFIVVNDTDYYFLGTEMQKTVKLVAANNDGTNLSSDALAYLAQ